MYLNQITISYISSMTSITMDEIKNEHFEERNDNLSVSLGDYFSFLSDLIKESNEFKYARYCWFTEFNECIVYYKFSPEEVKDNVTKYFMSSHSYSYEDIPVVIKECLNLLDDKDISYKIYREGNELFRSRLNVKEFEQSEEFQNAVFIFINKYKDRYKDNNILLEIE